MIFVVIDHLPMSGGLFTNVAWLASKPSPVVGEGVGAGAGAGAGGGAGVAFLSVWVP